MHPRHKQHVNFLKDFKVLFRLYKTNILVYVILSLYWIPAKKKKKPTKLSLFITHNTIFKDKKLTELSRLRQKDWCLFGLSV